MSIVVHRKGGDSGMALRGPIIEAMAYADPIYPVIEGLFSGARETPMTM